MAHDALTMEPELRRRVGGWFVAWTVLLFITVVIGGITRLTESGLSITEWKPVSGVLPPIGEAAWQEEFTKYQQIPQYQHLNAGMTLPEFKRIFWVEWIHRLWARLVGVAIAIPALVLLIRGGLRRVIRNRIVWLLALMAVQGAMGWYMVASGLAERTSVSQYRLAAHLSVALVLIGLAVWTAADLLTPPRPAGKPPRTSGLARLTAVMVGLVGLTAVAGAFVAGLDAGKLYNTFPLMGGKVVPAGYGAMSPWYRNLFENLIAVQFNHRLLGVAVTLLGVILWWRTREDDTAIGTWGRAVGLMSLVQIGLGIVTLLLLVPISMASMHQAGAVVLLCFSLLLLHALRRRRMSSDG
ncbi:MAG: COX15/CtaA family protein [Gemmatimonadales bacterium]|nr:COX15/CtaA family protein [Gemmatimonadales bacterium]